MIGLNQRFPVGTSFVELKAAKLFRPEKAGFKWKGVHHYRLVEELIAYLKSRDLKLSNMRFHLSRDNADIAFACNIINPEFPTTIIGGKKKAQPMYPAFGFIASNARRYGLTFYCGLSCPTAPMSYVGTSWTGHRYTSTFDPKKEMRKAVKVWMVEYPEVFEKIRLLRKMKYSEEMVDRILMEAGARGLLPWSRIGKITKALGRRDLISAWELNREFSKLIPMSAPMKQMNHLFGFSEVLVQLATCGTIEDVK